MAVYSCIDCETSLSVDDYEMSVILNPEQFPADFKQR